MNENENPTPEPVVETTEAPAQEGETKRRRGRGGNRGNRSPSLKDWIRVEKSQGNGLMNITVNMVVNQATGLVELHTQAPKQEGSDELEPVRIQVFRITNLEMIDDPNRDPLNLAEKAAAEAKKAEAAAKKAEKSAAAPVEAAPVAEQPVQG